MNLKSLNGLGVLGGLIVALAATPALAGPLTDRCASEAASRFEPGYAEIGKLHYEINLATALPACEAAVAGEPGPEVSAWLGRVLYVAKRYDEALAQAMIATDAGNPVGMQLAGEVLSDRLADTDDIPAGLALLQRAADMGYAPAINSLGYSYELGRGVEVDTAKALELYRAAAALGYGVAEANVGSMYRDANGGLEEDFERAVEWYRKSAAHNDPSGMDALGYAYEMGQGVPQDFVESTRWYTLAAAQNYPDGQASLAYAYDRGNGIEQDYAKAMELYQTAYANGTSWAGPCIGRLYLEGFGVPQDIVEAKRWIDLGLEEDDWTAMYLMGRIYEDGLGVPKNLATAKDWYQKAIDAGDEIDAPAALERLNATI